MSHARTTAKAPTNAHPKKTKNKKQNHTVVMVTVQSITFANTHTYAYTERASSGTAVRGDSYLHAERLSMQMWIRDFRMRGRNDECSREGERRQHKKLIKLPGPLSRTLILSC